MLKLSLLVHSTKIFEETLADIAAEQNLTTEELVAKGYDELHKAHLAKQLQTEHKES